MVSLDFGLVESLHPMMDIRLELGVISLDVLGISRVNSGDESRRMAVPDELMMLPLKIWNPVFNPLLVS